MHAVLAVSVAVVSLSLCMLPRPAFAQSSGQPAPVMPVPVYKDWLPPATPLGSDPSRSPAPAPSPSTTPAERGASSSGSGSPEADRPAEEAPHDKDADGPWHASIDAVFGFGTTPVVNQLLVGPLITQESRTLSRARFSTQSVNLGLSYEIARDLRIGAMLPLGSGSLYPTHTRGSTIVGNVAVGVDYELHLRRGLEAYLGLDVALPTASGEELPTADDLSTNKHLNQTDHDRFSLQHAMSDSRGREDTAAFAPNHLGLVPKVGLIWRAADKVVVEPYVKYESLHPTVERSSYEGAVVAAARGTYRFHKHGDLTLRVWTNIPTAGSDSAVVIGEPQLRGHFGAFTPILGVILPIAGELSDPYVIGVRAAIAARF